MFRKILLIILLAFPLLEIWVLLLLANRYGWYLLFYLILIAFLGWRLIQDEKSFWSGQLIKDLSSGKPLGLALFKSSKNILAGILLIIPGVISDVIALVLLLIPIQTRTVNQDTYQAQRAANDEIIEGEFTRED